MATLSEKAIRLIIQHEGLNQPGVWPGGLSGVTVGFGYDLGYVTVDQFESDWGANLTRQYLERLYAAVGLRAVKAKNKAIDFVDIRIKRVDSEEVFRKASLPLYQFRAGQAFPGFDRLPMDAQGALVSLVYNRGTSMFDKPGEDRRKEMRAIRDAVAAGDLGKIAAELRAMKRLWIGKNLDGLLARREEEALLVESCIV